METFAPMTCRISFAWVARLCLLFTRPALIAISIRAFTLPLLDYKPDVGRSRGGARSETASYTPYTQGKAPYFGQLPSKLIECLPPDIIVMETNLFSATGALEPPAGSNPGKRFAALKAAIRAPNVHSQAHPMHSHERRAA